jgi:acyl-CoA reductase-like NAD-dependent aldehyde dehydrogenase
MPPAAAGKEVFGPVVTVVPYTGEAEAVALANDSECGLAVSVWTAMPNEAWRWPAAPGPGPSA